METMTPMMRLICSPVSSGINTLQVYTRLARTGRCVRSPRHFSHMTNVDGSTSTTRVASCSTTILSRRRGLRRFRSFVSWVAGRLSTARVARSCLAHDGSTSTRVDENKPFYRSRLVVQEYKRQADWSFFTATPPLEALRSLLICATIEELPIEVGQPAAWSELMCVGPISTALPVCRASSRSLRGQEQSWTFAEEHVWLQRRAE